MPSTSTYPEDAYTRIELGGGIGGPIKRDRAWLFAAYQPAVIDTDRTVTFTFDGSTATKASAQTCQYLDVSQTTQLRENLRTRATFDWSPTRQEGMLPALDGATYPQGNFDIVDRTAELRRVCHGGLGGESEAVRRSPRRVLHEQSHHGERDRAAAVRLPAIQHRVPRTSPRRFSRSEGSRRICRTTSASVDRLSRVNAQTDGLTSAAWPGSTR